MSIRFRHNQEPADGRRPCFPPAPQAGSLFLGWGPKL